MMDVKVCAVRAEGEEPVDDEDEQKRRESIEMEENKKQEREVNAMMKEDAHSACPQQEENENAEEKSADREFVDMMLELSEENEKIVTESPVKKKQKIEKDERSPGYTTEESGDVEVEVKGSSSDDGAVRERLGRWENWRLRNKEIKEEPMDLSDSPVMEMAIHGQQRIFLAQAKKEMLWGYISRELALLERIPGWRVLPNGVVVYSNPHARFFHDASDSFGPEWSCRMTLLKVKDGDGLWEQVENVGDYAKSTLPFREIPLGPRNFAGLLRAEL